MRKVEYWRWVVFSDTHHKRVKTRWVMTEADALALDPGAVRVPGTLEERLVPETPAEATQRTPGGTPASDDLSS